ncbi:hypothetical protein [Chthoniobacter flavus]|uniref:hypothetical protein n=1 Tax=Chthoniobacter flavus TaxID=191863 RepID=UPI0012F8646A|nr:hypothetical protein [Chthoniobacter flavus]
MVSHPPIWKHVLKQQIHDYMQVNGAAPTGVLRYSRWKVADLPPVLHTHSVKVEVDADVYSYPPSPGATWHVNFADPNLFVAYGSGLLAQDELQVLEHPVLGSVREALLAAGYSARTRENDRSTPVLIANVQRQCALDTFPDPDQGRPRGLYGNQFQRAEWAAVQSALTVLSPAIMTNLICIAAPTGSGAYTEAQIHDVLETAFTGMRAAVLESSHISPGAKVTIHTGFWGCGAFGGNRPLMALLQLLAARLARVDKLVFYTGAQSEVIPFENGQAILRRILEKTGAEPSLLNILNVIVDQRFVWGTSDGN